MTDELLDTVAELPRVMPQIEVPVQAATTKCSSGCGAATLSPNTAPWSSASGAHPRAAIHCTSSLASRRNRRPVPGYLRPAGRAQAGQGPPGALQPRPHTVSAHDGRRPAGGEEEATPRWRNCRRRSSPRSTASSGARRSRCWPRTSTGQWRADAAEQAGLRGRLARLAASCRGPGHLTGPWSMQDAWRYPPATRSRRTRSSR